MTHEVEPDDRLGDLQRLIAFLNDARQMIAEKGPEVTDGNDGTTSEGLDTRARIEAVIDIHRELVDATSEQLRTVLLMTQMIKAGDMTVDFIHGDGDEPTGPFH